MTVACSDAWRCRLSGRHGPASAPSSCCCRCSRGRRWRRPSAAAATGIQSPLSPSTRLPARMRRNSRPMRRARRQAGPRRQAAPKNTGAGAGAGALGLGSGVYPAAGAAGLQRRRRRLLLERHLYCHQHVESRARLGTVWRQRSLPRRGRQPSLARSRPAARPPRAPCAPPQPVAVNDRAAERGGRGWWKSLGCCAVACTARPCVVQSRRGSSGRRRCASGWCCLRRGLERRLGAEGAGGLTGRKVVWKRTETLASRA